MELKARRYLGDDQTEAEGVPSQGGFGDDALLRQMPPHFTCPGKNQEVWDESTKWLNQMSIYNTLIIHIYIK